MADRFEPCAASQLRHRGTAGKPPVAPKDVWYNERNSGERGEKSFMAWPIRAFICTLGSLRGIPNLSETLTVLVNGPRRTQKSSARHSGTVTSCPIGGCAKSLVFQASWPDSCDVWRALRVGIDSCLHPQAKCCFRQFCCLVSPIV